MPCSHSSKCQLFPLLAMEPALLLWKKHYCEGGFEKCVRYDLSLQGKIVPLTLLPNGKRLENRSTDEINAAALFNAIEKKRIPIVKAILNAGDKGIGLQTSEGLTPLMAAASVGSEELVKLILEHGCNPWKKTTQGKTALDYAISGGDLDCDNLIRAKLASTKESDFVTKVDNMTSDSQQSVESSVITLLKKLNPFKSKGA